METIPFTLRNKITPHRPWRKTIGTLFFTFVGERDTYSAQFMGGFEFDNLILFNERTKGIRFATAIDLDRRIYCLVCTGKALPIPETSEGMAWYFAGTLVGRIGFHMRRLRLGGNDPLMVFWKAWNETWDLYGKSYDVSKASVAVAMDQGLQLVIDYHAYGPAIAWLREHLRAKCMEKAGEMVACIA